MAPVDSHCFEQTGKSGASARAWDIYIFAPPSHNNKMFRSKQELRRYFEQTGEQQLHWQDFDFNPFGSKGQHDMVLGVGQESAMMGTENKNRGLRQTVVLSEAIRAHQAEEMNPRPRTRSESSASDSGTRRDRSSSEGSSVSPSTRAATKRGKKKSKERPAVAPPRVEVEESLRRERSRDERRGGAKEKRLDRDQEKRE